MCRWVCTVVHRSVFSHVIHFAWWNWLWLNCAVKYIFSCKITWRPSSSHSKADMLHQNRFYLLWNLINQPARYCTLNSSLAVCYEMRSRCDVSSGPNQMGAMGCERWNSIVLGGWGGSFYVSECFLSWSAQEDAGSRPFALKCPHVRTGPKVRMYPLRQRTFTLQYIQEIGQPQYWWTTASTKTDVQYMPVSCCRSAF